MRVLFTGGGSGGHFYPIIAVAQKLNALLEREKVADVELYYMSTEPYDERLLHNNRITFIPVTAGKLRTYASLQNFFDIFKTGWGVIKAFFKIFSLYPDVVFSKGGYASFPVLVAARFFRIPVIIHESDSAPGRVNAWAGKFAHKVALSYPEAAEYFPKGRTAVTGNPIREDLLRPSGKDAFAALDLDSKLPVILVLGGSQGAQKINNLFVTLAPQLVGKYQVIHQAGEAHIEEVQMLAHGLLTHNSQEQEKGYASRYHAYGHLDADTLRLAAEVATLAVSRAGSTIFEIAAWGVPAILIPIAKSNADHQRKNAFAYARAGGATVIEEANLSANILKSEIDNLMNDTAHRAQMKEAARTFTHLDAAGQIAEQIAIVLLKHRILQ